MSDNLNKVTLIGNVGDDPKYINFDGGRKKFASFSLATSRNWFDAGTNERKSKTEWHRIVVYNENLVAIMERKNVQKSSKLYLEGSLTNRKWIDQKGNNRVTTEIVLQGFSCNLLILSSLNMNRNEDGEVGHLDGAETNQNNNNYEKKSYKKQEDKDFNRINEESSSTDDFDDFLSDDFLSNDSSDDNCENKMPF